MKKNNQEYIFQIMNAHYESGYFMHTAEREVQTRK